MRGLKILCIVYCALCISLSAGAADTLAVKHKQQAFPDDVPAGNFSGISRLGENRYAVVDDKSEHCGFYVFEIRQDSVTGQITSIVNEGFRTGGAANRDQEGIAFSPVHNTIFISGEADNEVLEYDTLGIPTGRRLEMPAAFKTARRNYGLESLSYNAATHRFWTTSESTLPADGETSTIANGIANRLRLQGFDDDLKPRGSYFYDTDKPTARKKAQRYAFGVSELCAEDDGKLLVLEREFFVPKKKIGSFVRCKVYETDPSVATNGDTLPKRLVIDIKTKLNLTARSLANYEGMCFGKRLADGRRTLILVSDSQNRYKGIMKDWFLVVVLPS